MSQMPFIEVRGLKKTYKIGKERVVALDDINLQIQKGEILCVLGTSGSGKSTLLNMLAGLERPTKGHVLYAGKEVTRYDERRWAMFRQKNIGFVFQSYNLMVGLTGVENVALPLVFRGMDKTKREKIAREMLKEVGLGNRMKHKPTQMSGGQQQRVGIARAFVTNPKIVFADEPTGNLDTKTTTEVMELMVNKSRENNQTFILVTHDNAIAKYADRILTIVDGKIVSDEPNESIARTREQIALDNQNEEAAAAADKTQNAPPDSGQDGPGSIPTDYIIIEDDPPADAADESPPGQNETDQPMTEDFEGNMHEEEIYR